MVMAGFLVLEGPAHVVLDQMLASNPGPDPDVARLNPRAASPQPYPSAWKESGRL